MPRPSPTDEQIAGMRRLREAGFSYEVIAGETGWSRPVVIKHTKDIRPARRWLARGPSPADEALMREMRRSGFAVRQVVAETGWSHKTVARRAADVVRGPVYDPAARNELAQAAALGRYGAPDAAALLSILRQACTGGAA
jgi:hypothetical protein